MASCPCSVFVSCVHAGEAVCARLARQCGHFVSGVAIHVLRDAYSERPISRRVLGGGWKLLRACARAAAPPPSPPPPTPHLCLAARPFPPAPSATLSEPRCTCPFRNKCRNRQTKSGVRLLTGKGEAVLCSLQGQAPGSER